MRLILVLTAILLASTATSQSLAARVAAAPDGWVQLRFAARPGVCGDGRELISVGRALFLENFMGTTSRGDWRARCVPGPVRVTLAVRDHEVERVRVHIGGREPEGGDPLTDLGAVGAQAAADYLLSLSVAPRLDHRSADRAILAAALADSAVIWPKLLTMARDGALPSGVRRTATFWLGRAAAAAASGRSDAIIDDEPDDDRADAKGQAIFALSQLPHHEGVPELIRVARTHRDPWVRGRAIFWLGESGDPRALDVFEELLRR
jgi:hypothetical protein